MLAMATAGFWLLGGTWGRLCSRGRLQTHRHAGIARGGSCLCDLLQTAILYVKDPVQLPCTVDGYSGQLGFGSTAWGQSSTGATCGCVHVT